MAYSEKNQQAASQSKQQASKPSQGPEKESSLISRMTMTWIMPYMAKARTTRLSFADLYPLSTSFDVSNLISRFASFFYRGFYFAANSVLDYYMFVSIADAALGYILFKSGMIEVEYMGLYETSYKIGTSPKMLYVFPIILFLLNVVFEFAQALIYTLLFHAIAKLKVALMGNVFLKVLKMPTAAIHSFGLGRIVNLVAIDSFRLEQAGLVANCLLSIPVHFIIYASILLSKMDLDHAIPGFGMCVIYLAAQFGLSVGIHASQEQVLSAADLRIRLTEEMLNGIQLVKCSSLEKVLMKRIAAVRQIELKYSRRLLIFSSLSAILNVVIPFYSASISIISMSISGVPLDATVVNVAFSQFRRMTGRAFIYIPQMTYKLALGITSANRLSAFFRAKEIGNEDEIGSTQYALELCNAQFKAHPEDKKENKKKRRPNSAIRSVIDITQSYKPVSPIVNNLYSLQIPKGALVAITGPVGSGKSSLIEALSGRFQLASGFIKCQQKMAVCSQKPWIISGTIRDNIVLDRPFDEEHYLQVLDQCCLVQDLMTMPLGDQTLIGSKGSTLSGGQKLRIALARIVYDPPPIVMLDDPFSALDANVSLQILSGCIVNGFLKNCTRVIVTQRTNLLPYFDSVVRMDLNGAIAALDVNTSRKPCPSIASPAYVVDYLSSMKGKEVVTVANADEVQEAASLQRDLKFGLFKIFIKYCSFSLGAIGAVILFILLGARMVLDIASRKSAGLYEDGDVMKFIGFPTVNGVSNQIIVNVGTTTVFTFAIIVYTLFFLNRQMKTTARLHQSALHSTVRAVFSYFVATPIGVVTSLFSRELSIVDCDLFDALMAVSGFICTVGATLFSVISYGASAGILKTLLLFSIVCLPLALSVVLLYLYKEGWRQASLLAAVATASAVSNVTETLDGIDTIRTLSQESRFITRNQTALTKVLQSSHLLCVVRRWMTLYYANMAGLIVCLGRMVATLVKFSPGDFGVFTEYLDAMSGIMELFAKRLSDVESSLVSFSLVNNQNECLSQEDMAMIRPSLKAEAGVIEFKKVGLRYYRESPLVLRALSFSVNAGEKVAIVGRSGAGKSSLINALYRMYEIEEGEIRIDGQTIQGCNIPSVRSALSIVTQEPVLFSGTIRFNLDPSGLVPDSAMWDMLSCVGLKPFIAALPAKLDTVILNGGTDAFSIGIRQTLCLTRALLSSAPVLLVDEASANLDDESERTIQRAIRKFARGTVLTIAHKLESVLECYDKVIVMADGQVAEMGVPSVLAKSEGSLFRDMLQAAGIENNSSSR